jgi:hypothetical protein
MSAAPTVPPHGAVLFRHRRRMPALHFGVVGGLFLLLAGLDASTPLWRIALGLGAVGVVALGVLGRQRLVVEDQLVTDEAVAVTRPDGTYVEIPFAQLTRAATKRNGVVFTRRDGAVLAFNRSPHAQRLRALLAAVAPSVEWVDEVDPACDT